MEKTSHVESRKVIYQELKDAFKGILNNHKYINSLSKKREEIIPSAEWLLDNIYLIEKEYKNIKFNIPNGYLDNIDIKTYEMAKKYVYENSLIIDEESMERYIRKSNINLTMGELWAFPLMVRVALIILLAQVTNNVVVIQKQRNAAKKLAYEFIDAENNNNVNEFLNKLSKKYTVKREYKNIDDKYNGDDISLHDGLFSIEFVDRIFTILKDNSIDNKDIYDFILDRMERKTEDISLDKLILKENLRQGTIENSIGSIISSLRNIDAIDWRKFFDRTSVIEQFLKRDPAEVYANMSYSTKDSYRHKIEEISRKFDLREIDIVKKALFLAAREEIQESYKTHVGYYLVDEGVYELLSQLKGKEVCHGEISSKQYITYIAIVTISISAIFIALNIALGGKRNILMLILQSIILLIPSSEISTLIVNRSISNGKSVKVVPEMDLSLGVGEENRTVVIIAAIASGKKKVKKLIEDLEIYYLANRDDNIFFAVLGDLKDSDKESNEDDNAINEYALKEIKTLNKKYFRNSNEHFFFFNRKRLYNEKEKVYMGRERKRGKIEEFINLLRDDVNTYNVISSDISELKKSKYIITLDEDTVLPMGAGKELIGKMSHILNSPIIKDERVIRGYGVMQPKIGIKMDIKQRSQFVNIFADKAGIDGYSTATFDLYQDVFNEGVFVGKGILNIDVFHNLVNKEIPENRILSHDLLEGAFGRTALVSDIEVMEGYPSSYEASCQRLHRWVRGDWQIASWINCKKISLLSRWKIFDNLRRSLLAPSLLIAILLTPIIFKIQSQVMVLIYIALLLPFIFTIVDFVVTPKNKINGTIKNLKQVLLIFSFIPYQSYIMINAISKALYRLFISKKNLLQWKTAEQVENEVENSLSAYYKRMWISPLMAVLLLIITITYGRGIILFNLVPIALWAIAPLLAFKISIILHEDEEEFTDEEEAELRILSRRIWSYYEDFVNKQNNYLAPDNFQEVPYKGVAFRTSPTNMGMALISNIIAYHLSYITLGETIKRIKDSLDSMETLEKYKGHYLNWYNTLTKAPLWPRYVSTVDSGNLLGYLWIVKKEIEDIKNKSIIRIDEVISLNDIYGILEEEGYALKTVKSDDVKISNYKSILEEQLLLINKSLDEVMLNKENNEEIIYWLKKQRNNIEDKLAFYNYTYDGIEKLLVTIGNDKRALSLNELISFLKDLKSSSGDEYSEILNGKINKFIEIKNTINDLIKKIDKIMNEMDFKPLYNEDRGLFSIGYNIEEQSLGNSYYDLLASESRATSFIAIARGIVPKEHWYKLSRNLTNAFNSKALASWSGTMFEYFMPYQIMKCYKDTIWNLTYDGVINAQINYAKEKHVPWGISESAYYFFDVDKNYQYKAFGVPGIGLKRGLEDEVVISPYSTIMTLPYIKHKSIENLKAIKNKNTYGRYGFIEAIDYIKENVVDGFSGEYVRCYMVHHLGMSFMALDNALNNKILQNIFHSISEVKATELLLQEKVPERVTFERLVDLTAKKVSMEHENFIPRIIEGNEYENKDVLLLSNGSYSTMISSLGTGYSKKENMMMYRWKGESTTDNNGMFFYIKNLNSNEFWSATYEPTKTPYVEDIEFYLDRACFHGVNASIDSRYEVTLSPEDDVEIRKIILKNIGNKGRSIEITSYMEVTLTSFEADMVHPSFSNLFISTDYDEDSKTLLANRRARAKGDSSPWIFQRVICEDELEGTITYETSRLNFIGRNRNLRFPKVMDDDAPLINTVGTVLDPILSLRCSLRIEPGEEKAVYFVTGYGGSKKDVLLLSEKYSKVKYIQRCRGEFTHYTALEIKYIGIKSLQANLYQSFSNLILYLNEERKDREEYIKNIHHSQEDLWPFGISGDLPIVLLVIDKDEDMNILRQVVNMHYYWKVLGLKSDLIIYNEEASSYEEPLQKSIITYLKNSLQKDNLNKNGGVFIHNKSTMNEEILNFLKGIASLYINSNNGALMEQFSNNIDDRRKNYIRHKELMDEEISFYKNKDKKYIKNLNSMNNFNYNMGKTLIGDDVTEEDLYFFNGYGGFDNNSMSYKIKLKKFLTTPAPWINVISNEDFGFHVSESGSAYTWCKNSRENKLTSWSNDWVVDPLSEALYIRDDGAGKYFSITPEPVRDEDEYDIEHGFGYSIFKHTANNITGQLTMFCPKNKKLKLCKVLLENKSSEGKGLTLFYYSSMVLGVYSYKSTKYISTDIEENFIYAQNPFNKYFYKDKTYLTILGGEGLTFTGDKNEFIGKGRDLSTPKALSNDNLSNTCGGIYDPCLAACTKVYLEPGEQKSLIIMLGCEEELSTVKGFINYYSDINKCDEELNNVKKYWNDFLGKVKVKTPDSSMNYLLNGWLIYQTLSCRYLARTAFYQSGGAYGFRDQLQDSMSLGILDSEITRKQILRSASRQYKEGDVQHWWHPVIMSGIRTKFSDDLLWLPYVTIDYIKSTGDYSILNEKVPYLEDEPLREGEDERYTIVNSSNSEGTIYQHCIKAIDRALKFGENNLPLMGSGDWNDGMNTVGNGGKGESVWLAYFLYKILDDFILLCEYVKDDKKSIEYGKYKEFIQENIEKNAWDGGWYKRAFFDDGTALGSRENDECKIDSLPQSWSVISGAAKKSRALEAMRSVDRYLLNEEKGIILLLAPPFNNSKLEPGYIKGYVPGVRENGGQYTHAATWVILAWTLLGDGNKAWKYYNMINPINHSSNKISANNYKIEPYVMAADIYLREPHGGRGGWSWYTGASGWMYKVGLENILGLKRIQNKGYKITPCVPDSWNEYEINIKDDVGEYHIVVKRKNNNIENKDRSKIEIILNNNLLDDDIIPKTPGKNEIKVFF